MLLPLPVRKAGLMGLLIAASLPATTVQVVSLEGFLHYGGGAVPQAAFNTSSPEFISSLTPNNLGSFRFSWTNTTGAAIANLVFTLFLDLDIDRDDNTFFNEYGELVSLLLPALAPPGALPFDQWEIDEPEYVFGNIYTNANAGALDNSTGVPASAPDDVSHALLFRIPVLAAGQTVNIFGTLSLTDAAGLGHFDPGSNIALYINGYATLSAGGAGEIPEPSTVVPVLAVAAAWAIRRRQGGRA
jgi:hypothetical protein